MFVLYVLYRANERNEFGMFLRSRPVEELHSRCVLLLHLIQKEMSNSSPRKKREPLPMAFDAPTRESEEKKENKDLLEVTSDMGSLVEIETKPVVGVKRKSPDLARPRLVPKVSKVLSDDPTPDPGQD